MKFPAAFIATSAAWNVDPLYIATFGTYNPLTVVTIFQNSLFTCGTKELSAVR